MIAYKMYEKHNGHHH